MTTPEQRQRLLSCPEWEFDDFLAKLDKADVLELIRLLQSKMCLEQRTFDALKRQVASPTTAAALRESQDRLSQLFSRNSKCFAKFQQQGQQQNTNISPNADEVADEGDNSHWQRSVSLKRLDEIGDDNVSLSPTRSVGELTRVPSVEDILASVRKMRGGGSKITPPPPPNFRDDEPCYANLHSNGSDVGGEDAIYENVNVFSKHRGRADGAEDESENLYENVGFGMRNGNGVAPKSSVYANMLVTSANRHRGAEPTYMNSSSYADDADVYENIDVHHHHATSRGKFNSSLKSKGYTDTSGLYDVPSLPPQPIYDAPKSSPDLVPNAARLLLAAAAAGNTCNGKTSSTPNDSLENGHDAYDDDNPHIPPPDYSEDSFNNEEGHSYMMYEDEYDDDDMGHDMQQGLEVILEEPEDEQLSSSSILSSEANSTLSGSNKRTRSVKSSEDGDTWKSTRNGNGINSTGNLKSWSSTNRDNESDADQADRCVEVYHETLRQRNTKQQQPIKASICSTLDDDPPLPSVRALRSQFEPAASSTRKDSNGVAKRYVAKASLDNLGSSQPVKSPTMESTPSSSDVSKSSSSSSLDTPRRISPSATNGVSSNNIVNNNGDVSEPIKLRPHTANWDPTLLVEALYAVRPLEVETEKKSNHTYVNIEGYLDKLPSGRRKATYWNAWKRRYFKAKDGFLYYYANNQTDQPNMVVQLMGGKVESMANVGGNNQQDPNPVASSTILGVDDCNGHYLVLRCASEEERERWKAALRTHTSSNDYSSTYVRPWIHPPTSPTSGPSLVKADVVVVDVGSASVRAGLLCTHPALPQLFFPSVVCVARDSLVPLAYGAEALRPRWRSVGKLIHPLRPKDAADRMPLDVDAVAGLVDHALKSLGVEPGRVTVFLSLPRRMPSSNLREKLAASLFDKVGIKAAAVGHQSIFALHAYIGWPAGGANEATGIVVDVGERTDVIPIINGYVLENGVSSCVPYGGRQVSAHLRRHLLVRHPSSASAHLSTAPISGTTEVDSLLLRLVGENVCFVRQKPHSEAKRKIVGRVGLADEDEEDEDEGPILEDDNGEPVCFKVSEYYEPGSDNPPWESLWVGHSGCWLPPEGLFRPRSSWGLDVGSIQALVGRAIRESGMDARRKMARSIYLAGGTTLLRGFDYRLQDELDHMTPPAITPKVHASPFRYHAAYIGACVVGNATASSEMILTRNEWLEHKRSLGSDRWRL